jgi:N-acetylated-alpha-linked acidic dipeptidase
LNGADLRIYPLGSGSDYTPFLQHLGIASLNIGFGGEDGGGSYHSIYDSYEHYTRFGDPGLQYGVALAKVCGRATLRLANADRLPFEFSNFSETVGVYVREVTNLLDSMREETEDLNNEVRMGHSAVVQDPKENLVPPKIKDPVPHLNYAPLQNALDRLQASAAGFQNAARGRELSPARRLQFDEIVYRTERSLTRTEGLPRRDWFRHHIYAPGFYTGYGVKTLPGVREAIEQRDWREAEQQIVIVAGVIDRFAAEVDRAAKLFEQ